MNETTKTLSVGQELKRIREQRGWSLEAASKVTRIRADQLEFIEQDRLDEFPSQSYVRGFIRIYSKALGLNPDIVMDHVERRPDKKNPANDEDALYFDLQPKAKDMEAVVGLDDRAQEWGSKLVAALVALVIIALIAVVYQTMQSSNSSALTNLTREFTQDAAVATEDAPIPVIPRERFNTVNRQAIRNETSVVVPATTISARQPPQPANAQIETPVTDHPSPQDLPVVRPGRIISIPQQDSAPIDQSTNSTSALPQDTIHTSNQELPPAYITGELPVRAARVVSPDNSSSPNITLLTDNNDTAPPTRLEEEFVIIDETPIPEEEVTLSDEEFLRLQQQTASLTDTFRQPAPPVNNGPSLSGTRGAASRAIPVQPVQTNLAPRVTQLAQPTTNNNSTSVPEPTVGPNKPSVADTPPGPAVDPVQQASAILSTPAIDSFGEVLNQLRLELSKEAYVRVFINDNTGNPTMDEVLPAGSAASWEGRTFYVTIRPADAATFYYNGKRYDYTDRGPENVTLRFP